MYNVSKKFPSAATAYFLDYYYPANQGSQNYFSKKLLDFKDGKSEGYNFFYNQIRKARTDLLGCDVGVRALSSGETNSNDNHNHPIHRLLKSGLLKNDNVGHVLSKPVTNQLKFAGSSANRKQILDNTYSCKSSIKQYNSVLIVDDVITTGTTIEEIIRSIKAQKPTMKIIVFCLSKTYSTLGKEHPKVQSLSSAPTNTSSEEIIRSIKAQKDATKNRSTKKVHREKPKSKSTNKPEPKTVDTDNESILKIFFKGIFELLFSFVKFIFWCFIIVLFTWLLLFYVIR